MYEKTPPLKQFEDRLLEKLCKEHKWYAAYKGEGEYFLMRKEELMEKIHYHIDEYEFDTAYELTNISGYVTYMEAKEFILQSIDEDIFRRECEVRELRQRKDFFSKLAR